MKRFKQWGCILVLLLLSVISCTGNEGIMGLNSQKKRGANAEMKAYPLGRFSIRIPKNMEQTGRSHRLRLAQIREFHWPERSNRNEIRNKLWNDRVAEINKMRPPRHQSRPIIEQREFYDLGQWAKGIFYYGNYALEQEGIWEILIDSGPIGIWLKTDSLLADKDNVDKMIRNLSTIAKAFTIRTNDDLHKDTQINWFHLENGAINLPYRWQEQTYARFEGHPFDLKLEIEMTDTHTDEPKEEGLLARIAAVIATGYATGVDIDRIRSHKRKVAGLDGEEEVDRMADRDGTEISFGWRYAGKKD